MPEIKRDPIVSTILDAAIEVHRRLGPGLLESAYQSCLVHELLHRGIRVEEQVVVPLVYKGVRLDSGYRLDLLIDGDIIVEIKSVETVLPIHEAQVITYLRLTGARQALLLNVNCVTMKAGIKSYLGDGNKVTRATEQGADLPVSRGE